MSLHNAASLNPKFAILDHVRFEDTHEGLTRIVVKTPKAEATLYTYGAHLTQWNPVGQHPGIYLSPKSPQEPGKAIRGGIPVLFPWFGPRSDGKEGPMHGFARISEWNVESTHFSPEGIVTITLSLEADDHARALGFDHFRAAMQFEIGEHLNITLEVTNHGSEDLVFEEGLHTYFAVGDITKVATEGLEGTIYLDKRDDFKRKVQTTKLLTYTRDVDQVHLNTTSALTIHDDAWKREIHIEKHGSNTTVTWNPWSVLSPGMPDLDPESWKHFVCVETVNVGENKITLAPGATHRMDSNVRITAKA